MDIIIGQEAICPDGLGRVIAYSLDKVTDVFIQVDTYVSNRSCKWAPDNITLIDPRKGGTTCP